MIRNKELREHRRQFDEHYRGGPMDASTIDFPLEQIDRFRWERGPYGDRLFSFFYRRFTAYILDRLQPKPDQRILNLGCGFGLEEKNLAALCPGVELWSLDVSREMVTAARNNRSPSRLLLAAAEALPFRSDQFDRIVSREVIEHVMSPKLMLAEISRCLKPGGIAVVTTEHEASFSPGHRYEGFRRRVLEPLFGIRLPGPAYKDEAPGVAEIRQMAEQAGLTVNEVLWDGALYHLVTDRAVQAILRSRVVAVARFFSRLETDRGMARLFCDQLKVVLRKTSGSPVPTEEGLRAEPASEANEEERPPPTERPIRWFVFRIVNRALFVAYATTIVAAAAVLVVGRKALRTMPLESTVGDPRLRRYVFPEGWSRGSE